MSPPQPHHEATRHDLKIREGGNIFNFPGRRRKERGAISHVRIDCDKRESGSSSIVVKNVKCLSTGAGAEEECVGWQIKNCAAALQCCDA